METKTKRYFHRIKSGQTLANYQRKPVRFFTLTTSDDGKHNDIARDVDVLIKRIRRKQPKFQYCKINTDEGNGVIHVLYKGEYITQKWLSYNWNKIHDSYIVDIRKCYNDRSIAPYLINQYLSSQKCSYTRMSYSAKWIFKGAVGTWKTILNASMKRCFYNPVKCKWYYKREEISFKQILTWALTLWNRVLYNHSYKQKTLTDYG
jgi:hypothetical protein